MKGASVSFRRLVKRFGTTDVLIDFNLEIDRGEFVTLLGPSGSGKSTVLNILAGFLEPTSGTLTLGGRDILSAPPEARNVGMVFQSYSLFPHMDVFDNVAFPLRLRKVSGTELRRRVEAVLEMVQLPGYGSRMPHELSGGQRQRVAFARAVVFEPEVLLMDEPLGALDLKLREAMQTEIKRYHRQLGCTILFVTHDQGEALALSDRIAVMGQARVVQVGTPQDVYDRPASRYVAEFIGKTNVLKLAAMGADRVGVPELGTDFPIPRDDTAWPRDAGYLCLRPERLHRDPAAGAGLVVFEANVSEVTFLGDNVHYQVLTHGGMELLLREPRGYQIGTLARGDRVRLGFDPRQAAAVPAEAATASAFHS